MKYLKPILLFSVVLELCCFSALYLVSKRAPGIELVYKDNGSFQATKYYNNRDTITGWPTNSILSRRNIYTEEGARPNPYSNVTVHSGIMIFGDSFARGEEVSHEACWSNLLSQSISKKVLNFGVSGFGTDQALLRCQSKEQPETEIIIVGFTSDNILRNVNTLRNLLSAGMNFPGFKPRFSLSNEGQLRLLGIPGSNPKEIEYLLEDPSLLGPREYFLSNEGPQYLTFPFSWSFLKLFNHYLIKSKLRGQAYYEAFYDESHSSGAIQVTAAILNQFTKSWNDKKILFLFFPQNLDYFEYQKSSKWIFEPLMRSVDDSSSQVSLLNMGEVFIQQPDFFKNMSSYFAPQYHYNPKGNKVIAHGVENKLRVLEWIE